MGSSTSKVEPETIKIGDIFPLRVKTDEYNEFYDDDGEEYEEKDEDFDDFGDEFVNDFDKSTEEIEDNMSMNSDDTLFLTQDLSVYCDLYSTDVPSKYDSVLMFMRGYAGYEKPPKMTWEERRNRAVKILEAQERELLKKRKSFSFMS